MKIKSLSLPYGWYVFNCLLVAVAMAVMAEHGYPLLVKVAAPLDSITLPPALLGLQLSSAFIGGFAFCRISDPCYCSWVSTGLEEHRLPQLKARTRPLIGSLLPRSTYSLTSTMKYGYPQKVRETMT